MELANIWVMVLYLSSRVKRHPTSLLMSLLQGLETKITVLMGGVRITGGPLRTDCLLGF